MNLIRNVVSAVPAGAVTSRGRICVVKRRTVSCSLGLSLAQVLVGCGSDDAPRPASVSQPPPPPPAAVAPVPPPPPTAAGKDWDGRYVGTVKIDGQEYFADALITVDGAARLYVGDPYSASGALQLNRPEESAQFVGTITGQGEAASGRGVVMGQQCAAPGLAPFCDEPAPAEISVSVVSGHLQGAIQVTTDDGIEAWSLDLGSWSNYYELPARHGRPAGQFREALAEFAIDDDVVVNVDQAGQLFFQSPRSGCTGNGTLTPHLDGEFNVFDVALTIESCNEPFAHLNGELNGLATTTASSYWNYDSLLRIWLSSPEGSSIHRAVTMLGDPL